ncbi:CAP-gly domain linker [Rhynchospora pubera]|uniref:CAP-gly domain linker n=1 Tax=Rhynchospora pubera TaxID=906938 RepID=A0AAV8GVN9_9POAL|nr:CAP-gly domain linker [Rhynchospora pubera]
MRRFFFFRSNGNEDNSKAPPLPADKKNYHKLPEGDAAFSGFRTPDDSVSKSRKRYADNQDLSSPHLRRSLSFSSPAPFHYTDEFDSNFSHNFSGSPPIYQNPSHTVSDCPIHPCLLKPERYPFSRDEPNDIHYSGLSNSDPPFIPPVPLRCHSSRITDIRNKNSVLDVYMEGERLLEEANNKLEENQSAFPDTNKEPDSLTRKISALGLGRPPRPHSMESNSFREARDLESETTSSFEDIYEDTSDARAFSSNALVELCTEDEALMRKAQEADEILARLSKENFEAAGLNLKGMTAKSLLTMIQDINEERRSLALELSTQINSRLAERFDSKEKYRISRLELETRMRQLEMEKTDWSIKVGNKYASEEKRLRERVRELAEQNVALQREISSLKSKEGEIQAKNVECEAQLDQVRRENSELKRSLTEVTESFKAADGQLGHLQLSYKEKEDEAKALHKTVLRLQRTCTDQEKSINSLRHDKKPREKESWYDTEISRLTGVEQNLRREVESCRLEIEVLRRENISFLERLNRGNKGNEVVRLEEQIRQRVDFLQSKGLCLLEECSEVCSELLKCVKNRNRENFEGFDGNEKYSLIQYTLKSEGIRKGVEGFKRSLQCAQSVLEEKSVVERSAEYSETRLMVKSSEVELEQQLKLETMINKILRENLLLKEKEIEQLQEEVASLVRGGELLQSEIHRMQQEISCLTYKTRGLEDEISEKKERLNQLQEELQETVKELTATRSNLKTAMEEKDYAYHEVVGLRKANKNLTNDVTSLHKRVESLEEDSMVKDGQIDILKERIKNPMGDWGFD